MSESLIDANIRNRINPFHGGGIGKFSFRNVDDGFTNLRIVPKDNGFFNEDIGNNQIFSKNYGNTITLQQLLNYIPAIQVREYTQETKADVVFSMAKYFASGVKNGIEKAAENADWKIVGNIGAATAHLVTLVFKGTSTWKEIAKKLHDVETVIINKNSDDYLLLVKMIYNLYYRMVANTTTNYYTLPCSDTTIFDTNGSDGWNVGGNTLDNAGFMGGA